MVDVQRELQIDIERGGYQGRNTTSALEDPSHGHAEQLMKFTDGKNPYLIDGHYVVQVTVIKRTGGRGRPRKVKYMLLVNVFFDGTTPQITEIEELTGKKRKGIFKDMYSRKCIHSIKNVVMHDGRICMFLTYRGASSNCQLSPN